MSFEATWDISGTDINDASLAFIKSARKGMKLKPYQTKINKLFQQHISENLLRAGMEADNFDDVFFARVNNGDIEFINTAPLITQRYEYGYYDDSNTDEEYYEAYMVQTSPRYFIRPAISETLNDIGYIMLNEAKKDYIRNH